MIFIVFVVLGVLARLSWGVWALIGKLKPSATNFEKLLIILNCWALPLFVLELSGHTSPYYQPIDPFVDACYSPVSFENAVPLLLVHLLSLFSILMLYVKGYHLPPIQISLYFLGATIGIFADAQFLFQISYHDTSRFDLFAEGHYAALWLSLYPILLILSTTAILTKLIFDLAESNVKVHYKNKYLACINQRFTAIQYWPVVAILFSIPVLILIVVLLILFGQEVDSFTKVYTETATWKLSQHLHPPTVDDQHGHYLCTVAALGSPQLVKPIGVGTRNNQPILVNRQLQIANAFEWMLQDFSPKFHRFVRTNYDRYGVNLSKRINNRRLSNLTYILMKPLEWLFLIFLYATYVHPERVIAAQYTASKSSLKT